MSTNKCVILNDIQKLENKVEIVASIDNYWKVVQRVSVGEFVTSELIDFNFAESIGASKWMLVIYPRGQYNQHGIANGHVTVFLRMLSCDNKDKSLMVKARVFFKSPYFQMKDECVCTMNATLLYGDVLKRFAGPFELIHLKELYSSQRRNLFLNGTLTIGCELVVIPLLPLRKYLNEFHTVVHSSYKQKNGMENQLESRDKSKRHTSIQVHSKDSSYRLTENKSQDLRKWNELLKKPNYAEFNLENLPPNDQFNMQLKVTKITKETERSDAKLPPKVGKLVKYFENMSMSRN